MTREEALACGSKTYDGEPCRHGHSGTRYVSGYCCRDCRLEVDKTHRRKHAKPASPKRMRQLPIPVMPSDFIKAPTLAKLMAGR